MSASAVNSVTAVAVSTAKREPLVGALCVDRDPRRLIWIVLACSAGFNTLIVLPADGYTISLAVSVRVVHITTLRLRIAILAIGMSSGIVGPRQWRQPVTAGLRSVLLAPWIGALVRSRMSAINTDNPSHIR